MKKLKALLIVTPLVLLLTTILSWSSKSQMMNTQTHLVYDPDDFQETFHDDFDSSYVFYGCKYFTFKIKHKCNEN
jgi:hypothetical protein